MNRRTPSAFDVLSCFNNDMDTHDIADHFHIRESEAFDLLHQARGEKPRSTFQYLGSRERQENIDPKRRVTLASRVTFLGGMNE